MKNVLRLSEGECEAAYVDGVLHAMRSLIYVRVMDHVSDAFTSTIDPLMEPMMEALDIVERYDY